MICEFGERRIIEGQLYKVSRKESISLKELIDDKPYIYFDSQIPTMTKVGVPKFNLTAVEAETIEETHFILDFLDGLLKEKAVYLDECVGSSNFMLTIPNNSSLFKFMSFKYKGNEGNIAKPFSKIMETLLKEKHFENLYYIDINSNKVKVEYNEKT